MPDGTVGQPDRQVLALHYSGISAGEAQPEPEPTGLSGAGGKRYRRYRTDSLDLSYWRKNLKKLEAKVEQVQKQIQRKRDQVDRTLAFERIVSLKRQIALLQEVLLTLLGEIDMARKAHDEAEEQEVLAVYLAYRRMH